MSEVLKNTFEVWWTLFKILDTQILDNANFGQSFVQTSKRPKFLEIDVQWINAKAFVVGP